MVELKISIERDAAVLARVMDKILDVHHYEQLVIYLREDWASLRALRFQQHKSKSLVEQRVRITQPFVLRSRE